MEIFTHTTIIDEAGGEHILLMKYYYNGQTYFITMDNKIFSQTGEKYTEVPSELSKEIFDRYNNFGNTGIHEYGESEKTEGR